MKAGVVVSAEEKMEIDGSKGTCNAILKCVVALVSLRPLPPTLSHRLRGCVGRLVAVWTQVGWQNAQHD